jgi:hypothetical protein
MSSEVVECYSGQTYAERPIALYWEGERFEITEIISRWRSPNEIYFRVSVGDERIFELVYNDAEDVWNIELR